VGASRHRHVHNAVFDIANAFDNCGSLLDEFLGQGETGVWDEVKQSLKEDPNGPQVDLREDLIKHLGRRVSVLTDYQLPITTTSERLMFAIEATNPKAVRPPSRSLCRMIRPQNGGTWEDM